MNIRSFLATTFAVSSLGLLTAPSSSQSYETAGLADSLGDATVSVLRKLGYDCQNASAAGIICKKCKMDGNKQKCEAFLCDAVTKKCRKKSAEIPNVPGLGGDDDNERENDADGIKLPSL